MHKQTPILTATTGTVRVFDQIARKHNVTYWLMAGTLIGAVRRGGIIPWDGDGDIAMLEEDYHRLKLVLHKELPRGMYFQTPCHNNASWGVRKPLECDSHWSHRYNIAKIKALCSTYTAYEVYGKWGVSGTLVRVGVCCRAGASGRRGNDSIVFGEGMTVNGTGLGLWVGAELK